VREKRGKKIDTKIIKIGRDIKIALWTEWKVMDI